MQKPAKNTAVEREAPSAPGIFSILFGGGRLFERTGKAAENAQPSLTMECFMLGNFATMEPAKLGGDSRR